MPDLIFQLSLQDRSETMKVALQAEQKQVLSHRMMQSAEILQMASARIPSFPGGQPLTMSRTSISIRKSKRESTKMTTGNLPPHSRSRWRNIYGSRLQRMRFPLG